MSLRDRLEAATYRAGAIDPFCGADADAFKRECRIPIFRNQWNVWRLESATTEDPSDDTLIVELERLIPKWIETSDVGTGDHVEVRIQPPGDRSNPWDLGGLPGGAEHPPIVPGREACFQPITMATASTRNVLARFVYRGNSSRMPWPVYRPALAGALDRWCPVDAEWALSQVYLPDPKNVPEPPSIVPQIDWPDVAGKATTAIRSLAVGYAVTAGIAAAILILVLRASSRR